MRVLHVISSLLETTGGPSRSVQGLVSALNSNGVDAWLMAIKPHALPWVDGAKEKYRCAGKFCWPGMQKAIGAIYDELRPDLVHVHSIWQWSLHLAVKAARKRSIPYVIAPRGTIDAWSLAQKALKKKLALATYQGRDCRNASAIHCTATSEAAQSARLWPEVPVILSPNAINTPGAPIVRAERRTGVERRALFMSRMHPKKGVTNLIEAWAKVRPQNWRCQLVYTVRGTVEIEYEAAVRAKVRELGLEDAFEFTGALDDVAKWKAYAAADLFVLPTHTENFGIVVAEALYAGVPAIVTKGAPWRDVEERRCGWWVDVGVEPLVDALAQATSLADCERVAMGERGRRLVCEKYSWDGVVGSLIEGYERILADANRRH